MQKTAYEMRISDWSSDVCSSDLLRRGGQRHAGGGRLGLRGIGRGIARHHPVADRLRLRLDLRHRRAGDEDVADIGQRIDHHQLADVARVRLGRSEEHQSEIQTLTRLQSAVFWLKKKK